MKVILLAKQTLFLSLCVYTSVPLKEPLFHSAACTNRISSEYSMCCTVIAALLYFITSIVYLIFITQCLEIITLYFISILKTK